jgi:hypothetical protein
MLRLVKVEEINGKKRFKATFSDDSITYFGQTNPKYGTFLDHHDTIRKENYRKRHEKDLRTKNPKRPGYLSFFLLWNKKTLNQSIKDFNLRLRKNDFSIM